MKNIDEIKSYFLEKVEQKELISKKHKKICATLNYIKHFLILASMAIGCISISDFASLVGIPIEITIFVTGLNMCAIKAVIKKYKSMIKKKKKKLDKTVLLAKARLNSVEVLISKALIDSDIRHNELF